MRKRLDYDRPSSYNDADWATPISEEIIKKKLFYENHLTYLINGTIIEPYHNQKDRPMATTITVKNIPQDLYEKLKKRADRNHRSINREIIAIFEDALSVRRVDPEEILVTARALREKTRQFTLTQDYIDQARREGRP